MAPNPEFVLRGPLESDYQDLLTWRNDPDLTRALAAEPKSWSLDSIRDWVAEMTTAERQRFYIFAPLNGRQPIGFARLMFIDWNSRSAEVGFAIGNPAHRGKGLGFQCLSLLFSKAFDELNLRRLYLKVASFNDSAIRLYDRIGMVREGALRQHYMSGSDCFDLILYGMLDGEWRDSEIWNTQNSYD